MTLPRPAIPTRHHTPARPHQRRRPVARWLGLLLAAVLTAGTVGVVTVPTATAATDGKLLLVLDSSGSMAEKVGGRTKISVAKKALRSVIARLPDDAQVGLRVYGATVFDRSQKGACTDSQLVVPVGTGNRAQLRTQVDSFRPYGETPIAHALQQAADDLGDQGRRTILLVSDGEETCDANPCATAKKLTAAGIDMKVDVIGLNVTGTARSQLQCIAEKGRGTYHDADNPDEIVDTLTQTTTRAFRPFRITGTPVTGGRTPSAAPSLSAGQYTDRIARDGSLRYYRLTRTIPGSTLHAGITSDTVGYSSVELRLNAPDGSRCGSTLNSDSSSGQERNLLTGSIQTRFPDTSPICFDSPNLMLEVKPWLVSGANGRPFELVVSEEPPTTTVGLPPAQEKVSWEPMEVASDPTAAPVAGTSISDAPLITAGTYRATFLSGEMQTYAVSLDWGQRIQVQIDLPHTSTPDDVDPVTPDLQIVNDVRGGVTLVDSQVSGLPRTRFLSRSTDRAGRVAVATPEIRYLNRESVYASDADVPGTHYLLINPRKKDGRGARYEQPYVLTVKVIGTAGRGAPTYQTVSAATPGPTASTGPVGPSPSSTTPPGGTTSPAESATPTPAAPAGPVLTPVAAGVGVGGAVLLVVVVAFLLRRRLRRP